MQPAHSGPLFLAALSAPSVLVTRGLSSLLSSSSLCERRATSPVGKHFGLLQAFAEQTLTQWLTCSCRFSHVALQRDS